MRAATSSGALSASFTMMLSGGFRAGARAAGGVAGAAAAPRGRGARGLVHEDAERRLEGMGEVAHLGAGPLQDLPVGVEEQVQFAGEGRDVTGEFPRDSLRFPAADRAQ